MRHKVLIVGFSVLLSTGIYAGSHHHEKSEPTKAVPKTWDQVLRCMEGFPCPFELPPVPEWLETQVELMGADIRLIRDRANNSLADRCNETETLHQNERLSLEIVAALKTKKRDKDVVLALHRILRYCRERHRDLVNK